MARKVVVFPHPLGPRSETNSPGLHEQIERLDGDHATVALVDPAQLDVGPALGARGHRAHWPPNEVIWAIPYTRSRTTSSANTSATWTADIAPTMGSKSWFTR